MRRAYAILGVGFLILILGTWLIVSREGVSISNLEAPMSTTLSITSPAFSPGGLIPKRHTCEGEDVSPPLTIGGVPGEAKSLILIVDDPDAPVGTWDHWVLYNIPPDTREIAENSAPPGAMHALNSWERNEYGGPCPPDREHRYFFKLYALDMTLDLSPESTTKAMIEEIIQGHVLAEAELIGRYDKEAK